MVKHSCFTGRRFLNQLESVWVEFSLCLPWFSLYSSFLPQSKDMLVGISLNGDSKLLIGVNVGVNGRLSLATCPGCTSTGIGSGPPCKNTVRWLAHCDSALTFHKKKRMKTDQSPVFYCNLYFPCLFPRAWWSCVQVQPELVSSEQLWEEEAEHCPASHPLERGHLQKQ